MTHLRQRIRHRAAAAIGAVLLAATAATAAIPGATASAAVPVAAIPSGATATSDPGATSIQYEEALAHASDPNPFAPPAPGASLRASVALHPRSGASGTSAGHGVRGSVKSAAQGLRREVFGFLPYWELTDSSLTLDYPTLSTIAYFSVGVDAKGNLVRTNSDGSATTGWAGWTSSQLTTIINQAHQQGVRVVLCLTMFAWTGTDATAQGSMLGSATARANLAQQAAAAVVGRGADGINLDFEPIASGHGADFTALVQALRTQLDARAPGLQLTVDSTAEIGNYDVAGLTAPGGADAIFVMGYDFRTSGSSVAGSIAPLGGPTYDVADALNAFLAKVPAAKLILGVPYYGRAWSTTSNAPNATTQGGTKYGSSTAVVYDTAADVAAQNGRLYDGVEQSAWTAYQKQNCTSTYGCVTTWRELYYDDAQSLGAKYDLVNRLGLRGVGMWALGYEGTRPELRGAIAAKFTTDSTPPVAGIVDLAPSQASETFPVAWAATDDLSGVTSMDVQVSVDGGPWTPWLTGTTQTSATYAGATGHTYAFQVRATDGAGHTGAFAPADTGTAAPALAPGGFAQAVVSGLAVRVAPDTAAQKVDSLAQGAVLAVTGGPVTASGYTWYQVTEPLREWPPVTTALTGVWVAAGSASTPYLAPVRAPNTTVVGTGGPDVTPPTLTAKITGPLVISPNGDGRLDTLGITGSASGASGWTLTISAVADPAGAAVRTIAGSGATIAVTWDGRGDGGSILPDGSYRLHLTAVDAAGNQAVPLDWVVVLDAAPPVLGATVSPAAFSPNGDGWDETATIRVAPSERVTGTIAILRGSSAIRTVTLGTGGATTLTWDGRDGSGRGVADGTYTVLVTGQDAAGNVTTQRISIAVDRTASLLRWSPGRFAPSSGARSIVSFSLLRAATTTLVIHGPTGRSVRTAWSGRATARGQVTWTWDGRDGTKHAVAPGNYVAVLVVRTGIATTTIMRTVVVR